MGFWDVAKKVGGAVAKEAGSAMERTHEYRAEMPPKNDRELLEIACKEIKRTPLRAGAARGELNKRHGEDSVQRMVQEHMGR